MSGYRLIRLSSVRRTLQPLLLGAAHAFSFSDGPLPGWILPYVQVLTLTFLALGVWRASSFRSAAVNGLLFGLGNFGLGLYWIYFSLHTYGGMPPPMAIAAVVVMALVLAVFTSLACGTAWRLARRHLGAAATSAGADTASSFASNVIAVALWASCWTLFEWLRGTLFTGFPWLNIGYSHVDGPIAGWAPLVGVYGVAWLAAFAAGAVALLIGSQASKNETPAAITVVCALGLLLAGAALGQIRWFSPLGEPLMVRLVQGNIPQAVKFDPAHLQQGIDAYLHMANLPAKAANAQPSVIVLPETVMPVFQNRLSLQTWQRWIDVAAARNATVIMGVPLNTAPDGRQHYTNSVIAFDAQTTPGMLHQGTAALRYDKQHLVPFGEFIPPGFHWFVDAMSIPLGDFDRGAPDQPAFHLGGQYFAPNICYEDVFGEEIIRAIRPGATVPGASILVNVSNLAWFGESWALQQHLQIARMRTLETGRPMLRATNTGMTAAIDADGTVRAVLPDHQMGVLDVEVQGTQGLTPYVRWGNAPVLVLILLVLAAGALIRGQPAKQAPEPTDA